MFLQSQMTQLQEVCILLSWIAWHLEIRTSHSRHINIVFTKAYFSESQYLKQSFRLGLNNKKNENPSLQFAWILMVQRHRHRHSYTYRRLGKMEEISALALPMTTSAVCEPRQVWAREVRQINKCPSVEPTSTHTYAHTHRAPDKSNLMWAQGFCVRVRERKSKGRRKSPLATNWQLSRQKRRRRRWGRAKTEQPKT